MQRNYRYRLYPTTTQEASLLRHLEVHRRLYNAGLQERKEAWERRRISRTYYDLANQLKAVRAVDPEAAFANYSALQQTLRRLDKAFAAFFRRVKSGETPGYPRFRSKHRFTTIEYRWGDGIRLTEKRLVVQRVGGIKITLHRPLPEDAPITNAYLKKLGSRWEVVIGVSCPDRPKPVHPGPAVGLDVGLHTLLATSDGTRIANPRWFQAAQAKLAKAQRQLSRRTLRSHRWRKQRQVVARQQERIANQRRDFLHKLSCNLTDRYSLIAVEDLPIRNMVHTTMAQSIHDAAWGMFRGMLAYKVENTDSQLIAVRPHGTSQQCSRCGRLVPKDLSVRRHQCPACGLTLDRDVNAARNVLARALESSTARTEPSVKRRTPVRRSREAAPLSGAESSRRPSLD